MKHNSNVMVCSIRGHLRSKIFSPFESPCMTFYLTSIDICSLSRTVSEIFDFKVSRVWPWPLTFWGHPGSKIFSQFESQASCMTSYLTSINTLSLYLVPFSRYSTSKFLGFDLDLHSDRTLNVQLTPVLFSNFNRGLVRSAQGRNSLGV